MNEDLHHVNQNPYGRSAVNFKYKRAGKTSRLLPGRPLTNQIRASEHNKGMMVHPNFCLTFEAFFFSENVHSTLNFSAIVVYNEEVPLY